MEGAELERAGRRYGAPVADDGRGMRALAWISLTFGVMLMGAFSLLGCVPVEGGQPSGGAGEPGSGELVSDGPSSGASASGEPSSGMPDTYSIECSRRVAGAERYVSLSPEGVVSWSHSTREDPLDGDGMADSLDTFTFMAASPGSVYVQVIDVFPWADREGVEEMFELVVGDDLRMERREIPSVERFELREQGDEAAYRVLSAEPGDAGFLRVSSYQEDFDGRHHGERSLNVLPSDVTQVFCDCGVFGWDNFHGNNPDVLDGSSFSFEATLDGGSAISASGTNSFPQGYSEFVRSIGALLGES